MNAEKLEHKNQAPHIEVEVKYDITPAEREQLVRILQELGFVPDPEIQFLEDHYLSYEQVVHLEAETEKQKTSYNFNRLRNINSTAYEHTQKQTVEVGEHSFSRQETNTPISENQYRNLMQKARPDHPVISKTRVNYRGQLDGLELTVSFDEVAWPEGEREQFVEIETLASKAESQEREGRLKELCHKVFNIPEEKKQAPSYLKQYIHRYRAPKHTFG